MITKSVVLMLSMLSFCVSCSVIEPSMRNKAPQPVTIPQKTATEQEIDVDVDEESQVYRPPAKEASEFNQRLQSIVEQSSLKSRGELFVSDSSDQESRSMSLSFYDADLVEVVRVFMDFLEEDYLLHPDVSGRVSLFVNNDFRRADLLELLSGLLKVNNMAMIRSGNLWEILPQSLVPAHISSDRIIFSKTEQLPARGQIIQGFRLKFISASEMINILDPYLSRNAQIYAHDAKGILLISDYPHSLEKASILIELFDESVFADVRVKIFELQFISAQDAVDQLEQAAQSFGLDASEISPRAQVSFLALERLNMVLAVTRNQQVLDFVDTWVEGLDRAQPEGIVDRARENIFVYYVQYGDAQGIVASLQGIFDETSDAQAGTIDSEDFLQEDQDTRTSDLQGVSSEVAQAVQFTVDETTNSILTRCNASDYSKVLSVIEKLDHYPRQVLIEVIIAEVQLSDRTKMGVDWKYILSFGDRVSGEISYRPGEGTIPSSGIVFSLESATRLKAALHAAVDDNSLQILSAPTILASDNKQALINIGDQVPYPTSTRRKVDENTTTETIDTTIQYRDTGIILRVTPKINKHGMVRMEISQEVSNLSTDRVEGITAPVISTRHTETTLAVNDQQTIVIAGLMKQERSRNSSGIPGLNRVPGIRHLFGTSEDSFSNTELLIFITPHVILSQEDSGFLSKTFLDRLERVKSAMR